MESNDLSLDAQEAQLREALAEIQRKKAEIARIKAEEDARRAREEMLRRPVIVRVASLSGGMVLVKNDYREDLVEYFRNVPGRSYNGAGMNGFPLKEWLGRVEKDLMCFENVTIEYAPGVREIIDYELNTPVWFVDIAQKRIKLVPGPRYNTYDVRDIPGCEWQGYNAPEKKYFTLPLAEGWRLFEKLQKIEGVVWSDEAREFVMHQVEMRGMLDKVGLAEDWDYDAGFVNGLKLRPFQRVGCAFVEATGGRALLAYDMGLGKTPMSLAYAWKNKFRTIIVCPASLKTNWCRQILKFTGQTPNVMMGAEPSNSDLITLLTSQNLFTVINYDILGRVAAFTKTTTDQEGFKHESNERRFFWVEAINMSKPDLVVFDESHYIKNSDSNRSVAARMIKCDRILHMTGTPVLNRPGELWPLLTTLAPDTFPSEETFINQYTIDGKRARNVEALRESLKSIMIRRRHQDVRKDMPPKNIVEEPHDLSDKAKKLYTKVLNGVYESIAEWDAKGRGGGQQEVANILVQIQRLKQICAIDKVQHTADLAVEIADSRVEDPHPKVLIFSQFKASAFSIAQRLGSEALCFVSRGRDDFKTADDRTRDALVQQFQSDPSIKFLVVTEKTAREGHDITKAGTVIFNDLFWTPANHEQAEGRAYMRESDPHGIDSYYLITDKNGEGYEIEEWIWALLKMKRGVINETVEAVEGARDDSVAMQLIEKMRESMWTRKTR